MNRKCVPGFGRLVTKMIIMLYHLLSWHLFYYFLDRHRSGIGTTLIVRSIFLPNLRYEGSVSRGWLSG